MSNSLIYDIIVFIICGITLLIICCSFLRKFFASKKLKDATWISKYENGQILNTSFIEQNLNDNPEIYTVSTFLGSSDYSVPISICCSLFIGLILGLNVGNENESPLKYVAFSALGLILVLLTPIVMLNHQPGYLKRVFCCLWLHNSIMSILHFLGFITYFFGIILMTIGHIVNFSNGEYILSKGTHNPLFFTLFFICSIFWLVVLILMKCQPVNKRFFIIETCCLIFSLLLHFIHEIVALNNI